MLVHLDNEAVFHSGLPVPRVGLGRMGAFDAHRTTVRRVAANDRRTDDGNPIASGDSPLQSGLRLKVWANVCHIAPLGKRNETENNPC